MSCYANLRKNNPNIIYSIASFLAGLMHVIYLVLFSYMQNTLFIAYNVISVALYMSISVIVLSKKHVFAYFLLIFLEVVTFVCISTITFGQNFGFGYVIFGGFILEFYILYSTSDNVKFAVIFDICTMLCFVICSLCATYVIDPLYIVSESMGHVLYYFNMACGILEFGMSFLFFIIKSIDDNNYLLNKNEELKNAVNYDELTKLLNRHAYDYYMNEFFDAALSHGNDFTVMMFDIDNFKNINDTYGHPNGDIVLQHVANVLSSSIRPVDVAFRWGGEEFLVVINGGKVTGINTAERCRKAISQLEFNFNDALVKISVTVGVCPYYVGATRELLVEKADAALYEGKTSGKDKVVVATF